ncbi:MAG: hypothetical protein JXQ81_01795 [Desulfuromonadales bacterium]|nr:hypothetical protein [Desulfuromonadales bacterium]MBN2791219.1 hypothetical protein [Desulfuromonadales bacterium]
MFWFIVLLLILGAGFYIYQKLVAIEREIRAEQEAEESSLEEPDKSMSDEAVDDLPDPQIVSPEVESMIEKVEPVADGDLSLEEEILLAVKNLPGLKQTEIYSSFSDVNRKRLQQLLKDLDSEGKIKREKQGSSYQLYPV